MTSMVLFTVPLAHESMLAHLAVIELGHALDLHLIEQCLYYVLEFVDGFGQKLRI
jgi:hypothetical protein